MADAIDLAQERIEIEAAARAQAAPKFTAPSLFECIDCGEDIPPKRQAIGGVTRCFDCQDYFERKRV